MLFLSLLSTCFKWLCKIRKCTSKRHEERYLCRARMTAGKPNQIKTTKRIGEMAYQQKMLLCKIDLTIKKIQIECSRQHSRWNSYWKSWRNAASVCWLCSASWRQRSAYQAWARLRALPARCSPSAELSLDLFPSMQRSPIRCLIRTK